MFRLSLHTSLNASNFEPTGAGGAAFEVLDGATYVKPCSSFFGSTVLKVQSEQTDGDHPPLQPPLPSPYCEYPFPFPFFGGSGQFRHWCPYLSVPGSSGSFSFPFGVCFPFAFVIIFSSVAILATVVTGTLGRFAFPSATFDKV